MEKPDCYKCIHALNNPGDAHLRCNNLRAKVIGQAYGIRNGWFTWPLNFDPTWLVSCKGFSDNPADKKPIEKYDPFLEVISILAGGRR
jgi:hypothetical protein